MAGPLRAQWHCSQMAQRETTTRTADTRHGGMARNETTRNAPRGKATTRGSTHATDAGDCRGSFVQLRLRRLLRLHMPPQRGRTRRGHTRTRANTRTHMHTHAHTRTQRHGHAQTQRQRRTHTHSHTHHTGATTRASTSRSRCTSPPRFANSTDESSSSSRSVASLSACRVQHPRGVCGCATHRCASAVRVREGVKECVRAVTL
jgi:hypothetical protein